MKKTISAFLTCCSILLLLSLSIHAEILPYQDPSLPIDTRVEDLLSRMSLKDKVGQMTQIEVTRLMGSHQWDRGPLNESWLNIVLGEHRVGSILSGGGSAPIPNTPRQWAELTNAIQRYAIEHNPWGIPILYGVDAVHGHNTVLAATMYPHNIGLAAAWNPTLVEAINRSTAVDVAATGIHWNFSPVGDLGLDMRWGRFYETFGEDPYLAASLAASAVTGLQGMNLQTRVAATGKHFLGYSPAVRGQDRANFDTSLRTLRELHYPPFVHMIEEDVAAIMPNSGTVNGVPVHASHYLLTEVLREEMDFTGIVVSDWEDIYRLHSVYRVAESYSDAIAKSINAGVDMSMVPHDAEGFTTRLIALVEEGTVSHERINEAVARVLTLKFRLGLFEDPFVDPVEAEAVFSTDTFNLAYQGAAESLTLLTNEQQVLPLAEDIHSVLVVGPNAHNVISQMGGWTIGWQGIEPGTPLPPAVTVLEGIEDLLGMDRVQYAQGLPDHEAALQNPERVSEAIADAVRLTKGAEAIVIVVGEGAYAEGEGDDLEPSLSWQEKQLIEALRETGKELVLVVIAGRPLLIIDIVDQVDAILMAYYPGTAGGTAIADTLFGRFNPSGRLPFSWPAHMGQLPNLHHRWITTTYDPLFAFGHGLSYTTFAYDNLSTTFHEDSRDIQLSVDITNTGSRAGHEIVPVFLEKAFSSVLPREQRLVAFDKVYLEPGATETVNLTFPSSQLAIIPGDIGGHAPAIVAPGEYHVSVGKQTTSFHIGR